MWRHLAVSFLIAASPIISAARTEAIATATTKADTSKSKKKAAERALPLKPERKIEFATDEGSWLSLDLSPDGQTIVFDLLGDLYTLPIAGGAAKRLTSGMAFDSQPRFSPEGKQIAFISDRGGSENVWIMAADKTIVDSTAAADSTGLIQLTKGDKAAYASPVWTRDGEYVLVSKSTSIRSIFTLMMFHKDAGSGLTLLPEKYKDLNVLGANFGKDDRYIYFAKKNGGFGYNLMLPTWQLGVYDRQTGEIFDQSSATGSALRPVLSPDGKWLVYATRMDAETGLRLRNLETSEESWLLYPVQRDDQESRFTRDLMPGYTFTPDSKALIISYGGKIHRVEVPSGSQTLIPFNVSVSLDLGPKVHFDSRVEEGPVQIRQMQWASLSPEGKRLAFTALNQIYVMNLPDGKPARLTKATTEYEFMPTWSPDGKWIAYVTWTEQGGHIRKIASTLPNAASVQLTQTPAFYSWPSWSPDGARIVFVQSGRQARLAGTDAAPTAELRWIATTGGKTNFISPMKGVGRPHFASGAPDRIYVYEPPDGLVSFRFDGTDRRVHLKVTGYVNNPPQPPDPADEILMSPDGRHAIALDNQRVYLTKVPQLGTQPPAISILDPKSAPVPTVRLTNVGAEFIGWSGDGKSVYWSLGNTFFRKDASSWKELLKEPKAAKDTTKTAAQDTTKKEEKETGLEKFAVKIEAPRHKPKGIVVLRGAKIVTMKGDEIINNGDIVVTDNRITAIGPSGQVTIPAGATNIDVSGKTVIPGFVDVHAHIYLWQPRDMFEPQLWEQLANLAYGVTTIRDPQTSGTTALVYSDLVETGAMLGPRVYSTLTGVFWAEPINSLDDAKNVLKRYKEYYKTNTIKEYVAGDRKIRQWIIMAAKDASIMPTTEGALDMKLDLTQMADGYPGNEHSLPIVPLYKDVIEFVARTGTFYTPTLLVNYGGPFAENYFYESIDIHEDAKLRRFTPHTEIDQRSKRRPGWFAEKEYAFPSTAKAAADIVKAGGRVCLGGHGQLQGLGCHWEIWALQSGGMSPHEALRCATIFGAESIGLAQDLGSLEVGKLADLMVLDKDPLANIRNSSSLRYVMKNGELFEAETLDQVWPVQKKLGPQYWQNQEP
jgi:Tol biopolymer transport system component